MGALASPAHEKFAQLLASGTMGQAEAFKACGLKFTAKSLRSNASRLAARSDVTQRIAELQAERLVDIQAGQAEAAEANGIDLDWLIRTGKDLLAKAMAANEFTAASMQYERLAKVAGLWVDRSATDQNQVQRIFSSAPLTMEQWEAQVAAGRPH